MKLLDFSKMKKVATDDKTTTFEHDKGHKMVILHAALPRIQQEQIKRLALYRGGKVKKYAEGTPDEPVSAPLEVEKAPAETTDVSTPGSHDTHITINAAPAAQSAPVAPAAPQALQVEKVPQAPKVLAPDQTINAPAAVDLQQQAIQEQVPISSAMSEATVENVQQRIKREQEYAQQTQANKDEIQRHTDEFNDYIKSNPINPRAYQESQTAEQKKQTAVGLFLGGLGGGGTSNVALDFLNKQIDRDIDAQKKNADNRNTVWGAYQHLYDDKSIATNMAKVSANDMLVHQTNLAAAKLGTAQAEQKAHELAAQKAIENNQLLIDSAGRLGTLQTGEGQSQPNVTAPGSEITPILHSGAEHAYRGLQYTPKAKDQLPEISRQFTQAKQADKALAHIAETFENLTKEATWSGRVGRGINPHAVAAIGGATGAGLGALAGGVGALPGAAAGSALGEGLGHAIKGVTNTDTNRQYDSDQSALLGYISAALKGTNISAGQIQEIVDANSPVAGDSQETLGKKRKAIVDFIKNHTEQSLLDTWNMTNH